MFIQKKRIVADDQAANVTPEASQLLFEAEDVADLLAEVTGEEVNVDVAEADDSVEFTVGEDVYTVAPDEDEQVEVLESVRRPMKGKSSVSASTKRRAAVSRTRRKVATRK